MRSIILAGILALAGGAREAAAQYISSLSTSTQCSPVSISSQTPTQVFVSSNGPISPNLPIYLDIFNNSASSAIVCSQDVAVSTQSSSSHYGWPVLAQASKAWTVLAYQSFKCLAASVTAAIVASVCITH